MLTTQAVNLRQCHCHPNARPPSPHCASDAWVVSAKRRVSPSLILPAHCVSLARSSMLAAWAQVVPLWTSHTRGTGHFKSAPTHTCQSHQPCSSFVTDLGKPPKTNGLSTIAEWSRGRGKVRPNARPNPKPRRARLVERKGLDCLRLTRGPTLVVGPTSEVARGATCKLGWGRRAKWDARA